VPHYTQPPPLDQIWHAAGRRACEHMMEKRLSRHLTDLCPAQGWRPSSPPRVTAGAARA
jgi:hypothetical protein